MLGKLWENQHCLLSILACGVCNRAGWCWYAPVLVRCTLQWSVCNIAVMIPKLVQKMSLRQGIRGMLNKALRLQSETTSPKQDAVETCAGHTMQTCCLVSIFARDALLRFTASCVNQIVNYRQQSLLQLTRASQREVSLATNCCCRDALKPHL